MVYSDGERTEAVIRLAINKYNYELTAEQTGISSKTLRRWDKDVTKKGIPELLDRAIERMLLVIPEDWSGQDWAIAIGILVDKWLLMQGEPTARSESIVHGYSEISEEEKQLVVERARRLLGISETVSDEDVRTGSDNGPIPS